MIETLESPYIHAATEDNFKSLVLENSNQGPVLVNFWSRNAGPCLRQYPILDKIIREFAGRVLLVNIDTQSDHAISRNYGITSVPTLKLFRNEKVVETWHGYQSEEDLTKVLEIYIARDSDQILVQAIQQYTEGNTAKAYDMITDSIVNDPLNPRLPLAMCKLLKHEHRYTEAAKLLEALPEDIRNNQEISQFRDLLSFQFDIDSDINIATLKSQIQSSPDDFAARQALIAHYVDQQNYKTALEELVYIIDSQPGYQDNYAQKAMLKLFNILGNENELVTKYRPYLKRYAH